MSRYPKPHAEPTTSPTKAGWRPAEWGRDLGISRPAVYKILREDSEVETMTLGPNVRIILTPPGVYLARRRAQAA